MQKCCSWLLALALLCPLFSARAETAIDLSYSRFGISEQVATVTVTDETINDVKSGIFGANCSFVDGAHILDEETMEFDQVMVQKLRESGVTSLRIPGGIEGDFMHWKETIGPVENRVPQLHPFADVENGASWYYDVRFGPDEWIELCKMTDRAFTIQLNAGNGTPQEAVDFIRYCLDSGVRIDDITVGNEVCMDNSEVNGISADKTPQEYIDFYLQVWNLMGEEMRNELDARGIPFGCIGLPMSHPLHAHRTWDKDVLSAIGDKTDFIDIHIGYSPYFTNDGESNERIIKCLLASADRIRKHLDVEIATLERYAPDVKIAISEHGPLRGLPYSAGTAGGIFLAAFFQTVLAEEKVISADYLPLTNHFAANNILGYHEVNGKKIYWDNVVTFVFRMYSEQIGRDVLATSVTGAKTFSAQAVGLMAAIRGVSEGDAAVYYDRETQKGTLFLLNKAYEENTVFDVQLPFENISITNVTELFTSNRTMHNNYQRPSMVNPIEYPELTGRMNGNFTIIAKPVSLLKIDFIIP